MLRYKRNVYIKHTANDEISIETDQTAKYFCSEHTGSVGEWWQKQHQSELRDWQKDIVIKYAADAMGSFQTYIIYKKGGGFTQPHDMTLAYFSRSSIFVFSTLQDFWIAQRCEGNLTLLAKEHSLGSILDSADRLTKIYPAIDLLKKEYNPNNSFVLR